MKTELKPCPFCGGKAKEISFVECVSYRPACVIQCEECGASIKEVVAKDNTFSYKKTAETIWNTRK